MASIYELNDKYTMVLEQLACLDPLDEEDVDKIDELFLILEGIEESKEQKIENYGKVIRELELRSDSRKTAIEAIKRSKKSMDNSAARLKDTVKIFFGHWGISKVVGDVLTVSLRASKKVNILDEDAIPDKYKTVEEVIKISKADIKRDLKDGAVEGAELEECQNVQIK